ncbi:polysaccharide pyruvyl transferase family protein [Variovorax sp. HJSM1_2]|uniref:polysaccharide pyruvyl transferase family protein n=1 Tax=Variovorax sp. HJSM1_2 TaxID=3366263 RepID=UPI003BED5643
MLSPLPNVAPAIKARVVPNPSVTVSSSADAIAAHRVVMQKLSAELNRIGDFIPSGSAIAYLDFPVYFNVGDQLINLGTEVFFKRMAYDVRLRMSMFDLCDLDWQRPERTKLKELARQRLAGLDKNVILVFQGGGNFGDIYPEFQMMRKAVVAAFPDRRIVVLPQSLHFSSLEQEKSNIEQLSKHPDLHVCVRDVESQNTLSKYSGISSALLPDMAHALWDTAGWPAQNKGGKGTLVMERTDSESTGLAMAEGMSTRLDWPTIVTSVDKLVFRFVRKAMVANVDRSYSVPLLVWYKLRDRLAKRAIGIFGSHDRVITDRLHGMILSTLLARPVQFSDNSYGKLSRYVGVWLKDSPLVNPIVREETTKSSV